MTVSPALVENSGARLPIHRLLTNEAYTGTLAWGVNAKDGADPVRVDKAFPAIVYKTQFQCVGRQLRRRAPKVRCLRRVGISFLLSGLVRCKTCGRTLSSGYSKSGQFPCYFYQSIMKGGKEACKTPRFVAQIPEEELVRKIRTNFLIDSNMRAPVKVVDEQMDGVADEQPARLEAMQSELADVRRTIDLRCDLVETIDMDINDFSPTSLSTGNGRSALKRRGQGESDPPKRRKELDQVVTLTAYAHDMRRFLKNSDLTKSKVFIESFVKKTLVTPRQHPDALHVAKPEDCPGSDMSVEDMALNGLSISTVPVGGAIYVYRKPVQPWARRANAFQLVGDEARPYFDALFTCKLKPLNYRDGSPTFEVASDLSNSKVCRSHLLSLELDLHSR